MISQNKQIGLCNGDAEFTETFETLFILISGFFFNKKQ
jgi:hypothetical protein